MVTARASAMTSLKNASYSIIDVSIENPNAIRKTPRQRTNPARYFPAKNSVLVTGMGMLMYAVRSLNSLGIWVPQSTEVKKLTISGRRHRRNPMYCVDPALSERNASFQSPGMISMITGIRTAMNTMMYIHLFLENSFIWARNTP